MDFQFPDPPLVTSIRAIIEKNKGGDELRAAILAFKSGSIFAIYDLRKTAVRRLYKNLEECKNEHASNPCDQTLTDLASALRYYDQANATLSDAFAKCVLTCPDFIKVCNLWKAKHAPDADIELKAILDVI